MVKAPILKSQNEWSQQEWTLPQWSSYCKDYIGQPDMSFTEDEDVIAYFTEGQCNALAWEIHKLTGYMPGLVSDLPAGRDDYMGHLFVFDSDGKTIDIRGLMEFEQFKLYWPDMPKVHRFFTIEDFHLEMSMWDNQIHYTRDREAKAWAKIIVAKLNSNY